MVHHGGARQQAADDPVIPAVAAHQPVGPAHPARVAAFDLPVAAALLHRRQRQEGGAAEIVGFQIANGAFGALLIIGDNVLHGGAQSDLNGHRIFVLCADQGGHRAVDAPQFPASRGLHHPTHRLAEAFILPLHGPQQLQPLGLDLTLPGSLIQLLLQLVRLFLPGLGPEGKATEHILRRGFFLLVFLNGAAQVPGLGPFRLQPRFQLLQLSLHSPAPGLDLGAAAFQRGRLGTVLCRGVLVKLGLCLQRGQPVAQVPGAFGGLLHLFQQVLQLLLQCQRPLPQFFQTALLGPLLLFQALALALLLGHLLDLGPDVVLVVMNVGLAHGDLGAQVALPQLGLAQFLPRLLAGGILPVQLLGEGGGLLLQLLRLPLPGGEHPLGVEIVRLGLVQAVLQLVQAVQPDIDLQHTQLVPADQKALGLFRLLLQRTHLGLQLGDDVPDAHQIFLAGVQLSLAFLLAVAELGDTGSFLEDLTPVGAFDRKDLVDAALADHRIAVPAQAGVHEQLMDVLEPHSLAVDKKLAFAAAVIPAGDHHLAVLDGKTAVGIVHHQRDLAEAHGAAAGGAAEDDVLHLAAPEGLCALLPQHPADCVHNVALSAAVGADDGGDTPAELHHGLVGKGLEALDLNGF